MNTFLTIIFSLIATASPQDKCVTEAKWYASDIISGEFEGAERMSGPVDYSGRAHIFGGGYTVTATAKTYDQHYDSTAYSKIVAKIKFDSECQKLSHTVGRY